MLAKLKQFWELGAIGASPALRRQIELSNQIAIFASATSFLYNYYYFAIDFPNHYVVLAVNLLFPVGYAGVILLNYTLHPSAARNLLIVNVCAHLSIITGLIGAAAGVHFFYFTLASVTAFLFHDFHRLRHYLIIGLLSVIFLLCQFLCGAEVVLAPVPSPWVEVLHATGVLGGLGLTATFLMLFRTSIDSAERELLVTNQQLEHLCNTDTLTGLRNRRVLDKMLTRECARLTRHDGVLSVMMCDVDFFKHFNDCYGHEAGDSCLQQVALALSEIALRSSDLVARYGGEEFTIVLPDTDLEGAKRVAEKMRENVESLRIVNERAEGSAYVTISIGISSASHRQSIRPETLLKRADSALYHAKANGRNRIEVWQAPQEQLVFATA